MENQRYPNCDVSAPALLSLSLRGLKGTSISEDDSTAGSNGDEQNDVNDDDRNVASKTEVRGIVPLPFPEKNYHDSDTQGLICHSSLVGSEHS